MGVVTKKWRWWMLLIGLVLVGLVAAVIRPDGTEPTFHGKKLSWWLGRYTTAVYESGDENSPRALEAKEAILEIGTNALPKLIEWLPAGPDPTADRLRRVEQLRSKFGLPFKIYYALGFVSGYSPTDHSTLAVYGFSILGERASQAVPELARMLKETNAVHNAIPCLARMGKPGLDKLLGALGDTNQLDRPYIAMLVGQVHGGTSPAEARLTLLRCTQESDPELVAAARKALMRLTPHPSPLD